MLDVEQERWEDSLEWAGKPAGELLAHFPEPRVLALLDGERAS